VAQWWPQRLVNWQLEGWQFTAEVPLSKAPYPRMLPGRCDWLPTAPVCGIKWWTKTEANLSGGFCVSGNHGDEVWDVQDGVKQNRKSGERTERGGANQDSRFKCTCGRKTEGWKRKWREEFILEAAVSPCDLIPQFLSFVSLVCTFSGSRINHTQQRTDLFLVSLSVAWSAFWPFSRFTCKDVNLKRSYLCSRPTLRLAFRVCFCTKKTTFLPVCDEDASTLNQPKMWSTRVKYVNERVFLFF